MELQASTSRERQGWGYADSVLTTLGSLPSAYLQHGGGVDWLEFAEQLTHSLAISYVSGGGRFEGWVGARDMDQSSRQTFCMVVSARIGNILTGLQFQDESGGCFEP